MARIQLIVAGLILLEGVTLTGHLEESLRRARRPCSQSCVSRDVLSLRFGIQDEKPDFADGEPVEITRTPPRLPRPAMPQRSLRTPPEPGMGLPS
jgi:hypothetical protein